MTSSRRPRSPASVTTRCGCSSAPECHAACGAGCRSASSPVRVLEFYASTEAGAILVNLASAKIGAMGRPLPGSTEVRIAQYGVEAGGLVLGGDGFAIECAVDEVGMLLARVGPERAAQHDPAARRVLERGRVAADRAICSVATPTAISGGSTTSPRSSTPPTGRCSPGRSATPSAICRRSTSSSPTASSLEGSKHQLAVAAVTLRTGRELGPKDVAGALRALPAEQRPAIVHVVESIPVTTWFRPLTAPLREAGIPEPGDSVQAWYLDASGGTYRALTETASKRLARAPS